VDGIPPWNPYRANVNNPNPPKVPIEVMPLFEGMKETVFKITGADSAGTGIVFNGAFSILRVTDTGTVRIFSRAEGNFAFRLEDGEGRINTHEYLDLDGDGWKEIIEERKDCDYKFDKDRNEYQQIVCTELPHNIYKFDGTEYVVIE
jgi:hypothetical protein